MKTVVIAAASIAMVATQALAKKARCFTTGEGYFACRYTKLDGQGSFQISSPDKPTYTVDISDPGFAFVFVKLGTRNIAVPGQYVRQRDDPACWANPETNAKLCAW